MFHYVNVHGDLEVLVYGSLANLSLASLQACTRKSSPRTPASRQVLRKLGQLRPLCNRRPARLARITGVHMDA